MKNLKSIFDACIELADMNKKHITKEDVEVMATKYNLKYGTLATGWDNFQQTGGKYVDRRCTTGAGTKHFKSTIPYVTTKNQTITRAEAGSMIVEYMTTKIKSRELCLKYNVSVNQFYSWIDELNVAGTLFGKMILNPTKYAKLEVKDIIWYYRFPETKRKSIANLTYGEKSALRRVATVLLKYLPQKKEEEVA